MISQDSKVRHAGTQLALDSVGLLTVLDFLLPADDVDDDDVLPPDVADDSGWALLLAGFVADLLGPFVGSGRDPFAFSKMGITLDFEAGWKL